MPSFGKRSLERLATCHEKIRYVMHAAIQHHDFTILQGHRTREEQNEAFNNKRSLVKWPNSKHNIFPSQAIDIAPWWPEAPHIRWERRDEFILLAGIIIGIADQKGIAMRWGGNWDGDIEIITDQKLVDLPHLELIIP